MGGEAVAGASGAKVGAGRAERDYRHYHCREEGSAGGEGSEGTKKEGERAEGHVLPSDHRHEEDQEDEQEAAQVDLEDGYNGRQAQGLHQEGEEGCGDGHNKVSADSDKCGTRFSVFGKSKVRRGELAFFSF